MYIIIKCFILLFVNEEKTDGSLLSSLKRLLLAKELEILKEVFTVKGVIYL